MQAFACRCFQLSYLLTEAGGPGTTHSREPEWHIRDSVRVSVNRSRGGRIILVAMRVRILHEQRWPDLSAAEPSATLRFVSPDAALFPAEIPVMSSSQGTGTISASQAHRDAIHERERGFIAEAIDAVAGATARLRILIIEAPPFPLGDVISARGHAGTSLISAGADVRHASAVAPTAPQHGARRPGVIAHCVQLPFRDASFDVVVWARAFERVPPGNDRIVLWDIARVLGPHGHLVITLDAVAEASGALRGRSGIHLTNRPHHHQPIHRLLDRISETFPVEMSDVPTELTRATGYRVNDCPLDRVEHDLQIAATGGKRVVIGAVLERRPDTVRPSASALVAAYLEGQMGVQRQLDDAQAVAVRLARTVRPLEAHVASMTTELAAARVSLTDTAAIAEQRLTIMRGQSLAVQEFRSAADERLDAMQQMDTQTAALRQACDERLGLILQMEAEIQGLRRAADERLEMIQQKDAQIHTIDVQWHEMLEQMAALRQTCDERLGLIHRMEAEAQGLRRAADERLEAMRAKDARIRDLLTIGAERLEAVDRMNAQIEELHQACDQRLDLIHRMEGAIQALRQACDERLDLIHQKDMQIGELQSIYDQRPATGEPLDEQIEALDAQIEALRQACDERLNLINRMEAEIQELRRVSAERLQVIQQLEQVARDQLAFIDAPCNGHT
jgi:SAM-dependent methyltransferase